jgi:hypothetical protein
LIAFDCSATTGVAASKFTARLAEKQRPKLNITWDDLIIPAPPDAERDMAA